MMTKREVASLALKLLGIYAFIISVSLLHSMMLMIATYSAQYADHLGQVPSLTLLAAGSMISLLLLIFLGCYLIMASERLSRLIFPQEGTEDKISSLSSRDVQTIAFSIVGVLLLTSAVPGLFRVMLRISQVLYHQKNLFSTVVKGRIIEDSVVLVVRLTLGLYLFLGSKGLSRLWHKIQQTRGM